MTGAPPDQTGTPSRHYGLLPTTPDDRDYRLARSPHPYDGPFVDLTDGFRDVPYDQGRLGSCVANGVAACADYARARDGLPPVHPSRLFVYWNGRSRAGYPINQDTGLQIRDGLTAVAKDGAPPETDWGYDIARFADKPPVKAYTDGADDVALKFGRVDPGGVDAAVAGGYPVVQGFDVYASFESTAVAQTGIVPMPAPGEALYGGHCTVICTTPVDGGQIGGIPGVLYRKHLNSWGLRWGLGGYYWAPVEFTANHASDFWVITAMGDPDGPTPPPPGPPVPAGPDEALAGVLRPWLPTKHTSRRTNQAVADAAAAWLTAKGL